MHGLELGEMPHDAQGAVAARGCGRRLGRPGPVDIPGRSGVAVGVGPVTTKVAGAPGRVSDRVPLWNSLERR